MRFGHPSTRRLQRWLDGEEAGLDAHLADCGRCAERVEHLDDATADLGPRLAALLSPPEEVIERVRGGVDSRLRSQEDFALISELFGLPIRAARVMSSTTQGET